MFPDMNRDADHLHLLSVFHYVYAGLTAVFSCFPAFYVLLGFGFIAGAMGSGDAPPGFVGGLFALIGFVAFIFMLALAALTAYAGKCLSEQKRYTFCIVIAAISCLSFPFGTALGVFTIVILQRPGVRQMFNQSPPPQP